MKIWLKTLALLTFLPLTSLSNIDNFEGKIKIVKESIYDTLQIELSVKNNIVRIDETNLHKNISRCYLVDLSREKIYALSFKDKLYSEIPLNNPKNNSNVDILKTQNTMEVNGVICHQWRVRNKSKNSEVTYWVAQKDLGFMESLINIISRSETPLGILSQFPKVNGYLPLISIDRTLLRKVKESAKVIDIKRTTLPENLFVIPPGFRELLG
jgi:hypothetical protein